MNSLKNFNSMLENKQKYDKNISPNLGGIQKYSD